MTIIQPVTDPALIVLIGVAGSGKSTLAAARWRPAQVLSLDALRGLVSDDECDQSATRDAVAVLHALAAARLSRRLTTVIDATNVEAGVRLGLTKLAASRGMPAVAIVVDTPITICQARNAARSGPRASARWGRRVPADVVDAQHQQLRAAIPQLRGEGFAEILLHEPDVTDPTKGQTRTFNPALYLIHPSRA